MLATGFALPSTSIAYHSLDLTGPNTDDASYQGPGEATACGSTPSSYSQVETNLTLSGQGAEQWLIFLGAKIGMHEPYAYVKSFPPLASRRGLNRV